MTSNPHREGQPNPDAASPTLTTEAQDVLEAVLEMVAAWPKPGTDSEWEPTKETMAVREAVNAYRATLPPKDYAPEELEPGTRFRFVGDERVYILGTWMNYAGSRFAIPADGRIEDSRGRIHDGDRIIPLPDQDA